MEEKACVTRQQSWDLDPEILGLKSGCPLWAAPSCLRKSSGFFYIKQEGSTVKYFLFLVGLQWGGANFLLPEGTHRWASSGLNADYLGGRVSRDGPLCVVEVYRQQRFIN